MADTGNDENHGVFREALQPLAGYHAVIAFAIGELVCFGNSLPQYRQLVFVTKPPVPKIMLTQTCIFGNFMLKIESFTKVSKNLRAAFRFAVSL